jgi:hypothetical protein
MDGNTGKPVRFGPIRGPGPAATTAPGYNFVTKRGGTRELVPPKAKMAAETAMNEDLRGWL